MGEGTDFASEPSLVAEPAVLTLAERLRSLGFRTGAVVLTNS